MRAYLACFDISDDRIRYQVAKCLGQYGLRVQYSVFEISIERPKQLHDIKRQLKDLLEPGDDLRFYALCLNCRRNSYTVDDQRIAQFPAVVIV